MTDRANSFVSNSKDVWRIKSPVRPGFHRAGINESEVMLLNLADHCCIELVLEQRVNSLDFNGKFIFTSFLKKSKIWLYVSTLILFNSKEQ